MSMKQVVRFKEKNYDFGNKVVSECLANELRCKNGGIEYICKWCHNSLHCKPGLFPKMPKKAQAREGKVCHKCQNNGNKEHTIRSHWDHIWK